MDYGKLKGKLLMNLTGPSLLTLVDDIVGTRGTKKMAAFVEILKQTHKDTHEWYNHQGNRDSIKSALGITEPTINAYISDYVKTKILIKMKPRGLYKINEKYLTLIP